MAKELPYFQFEPAEYLTKDVSFCSLSAQGLFINICAYYWQRECKLTKDQLLRRLNHPKELDELICEKVISVKGNDISVSFLDNQYKKATKQSNTNSVNGSKGGRPKKTNPIESEIKPTLNPIKTQTKGIREDKRREEEIREEEEESKPKKFVFLNSLIDNGADKELAKEWLLVRKNKSATNTQTALNGFISQTKKCKININQVLKICIEKSWSGFNHDWVKGIKPETNTKLEDMICYHWTIEGSNNKKYIHKDKAEAYFNNQANGGYIAVILKN